MEDIQLLQTQLQSMSDILKELHTVIGTLENAQEVQPEVLHIIHQFFREFVLKEHFLAVNTFIKSHQVEGATDTLMRLQGLSIVYFERWQHEGTCLEMGIHEARTSFIAYAESLLYVMQQLINEENKLYKAFGARIT